MTANSCEGPSFFARYIDGPEKEQHEPERLRTGRDTVHQWMQLCIDANAIKLTDPETPSAINLGADPKPTWVATRYLYASYRATCEQHGTWYPVNNRLFGRVLTETLGPAHRSIVVPEIMFGQGERTYRPWGHFIPSAEIWRELLDARLRLPKQTIPKLTRLMKTANKLLHDSRVGLP
jgi:hypothetical protein